MEKSMSKIGLPLNHPLWLWIEFTLFYIATPATLFFHATRWNIHACLWIIGIYALILLHRMPNFSWRREWQGGAWPMAQRKIAILRFVLSTAAIILLTEYLVPERLMTFPIQRPGFWLIVMLLYPILSALPQELVFRTYFFHRYARIFPSVIVLVAVSAMGFGFVHMVFHNWISPSLSVIGGVFFAQSYSQHRSLKWAAIEHAAYGCMIFTIGIGTYFLVGGGHHL